MIQALYVALGAYVFGVLVMAFCVAVARAQQEAFRTPLALAIVLTVLWPLALAWTVLSAAWAGTVKELRARVSNEPQEAPPKPRERR